MKKTVGKDTDGSLAVTRIILIKKGREPCLE